MADLTITGQTYAAPGAVGYSKSGLLELTRWYIDTLGTDYLQDDVVGKWDLGQCLDLAYLEYARRTRCFPVILTADTFAGQSTYRYADFGSGAGARVFDIVSLVCSGYQFPMTRMTEREMNRELGNWRTAENGIPQCWIPWGDRGFRLYRVPDAVYTLTLEGWETPDLSLFTSDSSPDIHQAEQPLLAIYAAIMATIRNPNDENLVRQHTLYPQWESGVTTTAGRIGGAGGEVITVGRYANGAGDPGGNFTVATSITPFGG